MGPHRLFFTLLIHWIAPISLYKSFPSLIVKYPPPLLLPSLLSFLAPCLPQLFYFPARVPDFFLACLLHHTSWHSSVRRDDKPWIPCVCSLISPPSFAGRFPRRLARSFLPHCFSGLFFFYHNMLPSFLPPSFNPPRSRIFDQF